MTKMVLMQVKISVFAGWAARVISMACGLVNAGLLMHLLGADGYAIQSILMSFASWLALVNLGLPKAIQNEISKLRAEGKDYSRRKYAVCAVAGLIMIVAVPMLMLVSSVINHVLLNKYAVSDDVIFTSCLALLAFGLSPIFTQILFAEYRPFWPNVSGGLISLLQTSLLLLLKILDVRDFRAIMNVYVGPWLLASIVMIFLVGNFREWKLSWEEFRPVLKKGAGFAVFAAMSAAMLNLDYTIMALLLNSQQIVDYSLASKLFTAPLSINAILLTVCWTPISDLYFSNDYAAVRTYVWRILAASSIVIIFPALMIILLSKELVPVISAGQLKDLPGSLMWAWLCLICVRAWSDTFAMTLMCMGKINILNKYIFMQAAVSVSAQCWLASHFGETGIVMGTLLSFGLTAVWIYPTVFVRSTRVAVQ